MAGIDEHTVLMLNFTDDPIVDESDSEHAITVVAGTSRSTDQYKFSPASGYFGGSTGYMSVPQHSDFDFNTGDVSFTIEAWIRRADTAYVTIYSQTDGFYSRFFINGTILYWQDTDVVLSVDLAWTLNRWYHVAVVRDEPNDMYYLFRDGEIVQSVLDTDKPTLRNANVLIGALYWLGSYEGLFNGYIDELRVSRTARWTEAFTPPTEPYSPPSIYKISGEISQNESDIIIVKESDWSVESKTTKPIGSYSITTTEGKKTVIGRRTDSGRVIAHGNVDPEEIAQ